MNAKPTDGSGLDVGRSIQAFHFPSTGPAAGRREKMVWRAGWRGFYHWLWLPLVVELALAPCGLRAAGTWTPLANLAPDTIDTLLLLSDGTVMAASGEPSGGGAGSAWYRLRPDATGSYINGTWSTLAPMNYTRLYYCSQVLRDGRVFVAGGEYGTGTNSAEIYDPVANTWTGTPPPPAGQGVFSDSVSQILPNGDVLISPVVPATYDGTVIYSVASNAWFAGGTLVNDDYGDQDEASWVKLPDDSILTIGPFSTNSQRYIPSLNQWVADANVPVEIYDPFGGEMGPGFLLPSGNAIFFGGTGNSAIYTPSGNTNMGVWQAGPVIPNSQGMVDAPGAMMVNGKILCAVEPLGTASTNEYLSPTTFYEYDPVANSFAQVNGPVGTTFNSSSFPMRMLDLPDGTVLFSDTGTQLFVYQPDGSPLAAGQPTINTISTNLDGSYHLTGRLFNGISQGAAYGDDAQMNSNYPLVRMTNSSGAVYYARTYNWSSTGVMTGANIVTTDFAVPANLPVGIYSLAVVANGIASNPIQFVFAPDALLITPGTAFTFGGPAGGPFNANSTTLTLTNVGPSTLNWSLGHNPTWFSASPGGGSLTPGGPAATVTVSLNSTASNLVFGTYTANLWFTNLSDHFVQSRPFNLQINPPQLVPNGGFETGDFTDWTLNGYGYNFTFVDNGSYFPSIRPHSGNYFALLGQTGFLGTLSQNIATTPGQFYLLSLWMNSPDGGGYNEFSVSWDGNTLFDGVNLPALGWTNLQFIVEATSASTVLQTGFRDEATWLGLDDVSVTAIRLPVLEAPVKAGGSVNLNWTTMAGLAYQLQYKTNLNQTGWINLGNPLTASGGIIATNDVSADPQRFYRLQVLP
ncbi:MAG: kelch repeat-containing protein [Verrucomicrobiia bacterium]